MKRGGDCAVPASELGVGFPWQGWQEEVGDVHARSSEQGRRYSTRRMITGIMNVFEYLHFPLGGDCSRDAE